MAQADSLEEEGSRMEEAKHMEFHDMSFEVAGRGGGELLKQATVLSDDFMNEGFKEPLRAEKLGANHIDTLRSARLGQDHSETIACRELILDRILLGARSSACKTKMENKEPEQRLGKVLASLGDLDQAVHELNQVVELRAECCNTHIACKGWDFWVRRKHIEYSAEARLQSKTIGPKSVQALEAMQALASLKESAALQGNGSVKRLGDSVSVTRAVTASACAAIPAVNKGHLPALVGRLVLQLPCRRCVASSEEERTEAQLLGALQLWMLFLLPSFALLTSQVMQTRFLELHTGRQDANIELTGPVANSPIHHFTN
ncbi:hypothetical protein AK812_SmicGene1739 [Symbiodinium microadriaticum]|uniref:Uncharacterized protein n=1 Tax=Symbiodinium microadriaticum TaxID=2951 RepID=A0A1Q9F3F0_SYMMI|nr:hypothetical protein AK812_SmicGene1739 [Symbiodinium microadriaticum]